MQIALDIIFLTITIGSSISILLGRNWKWLLIFLASQYLGVFWFVHLTWPLSLAIIKLISGLIVCIILAFYSEAYDVHSLRDTSWPQGIIFRIFAAGLISISTLAVSTQASLWLGISNTTAMWIGLFLIGMGILQLGITAQTERVIIALLTLLSGFEIIYAFVETSSLVAALLVAINIGLAVVGVYLHLMDQREDTQ
jgi:hypothetical protein